MAQAKGKVVMSRPNVAPTLDQSKVPALPKGTTIEKRADGSVWKVTQNVKEKGKTGPDSFEVRVDSRQDRDYISRGERPWYLDYLDDPKSKAAEEESE